MSDVEMENDDVGASSHQPKEHVYVPGKTKTAKADEELEYDPKAYVVYRQFEAEYPCLSFDPLHDNEGDAREQFPLSCMLVCGTQAEKARNNKIITIKLTNIRRTKADDSDEELDDEEDEEDADDDETGANAPHFYSASIAHQGGINRVRATRLTPTVTVCAVWNDAGAGKVQLWNLAQSIRAVNESSEEADSANHTVKEVPLQSCVAHDCEGFAIDWSTQTIGALASGDTKGKILLWSPQEGGKWAVSPKPLTAHRASVEDIQWSPSEASLFASVSVDRTIRLWDTRVEPKHANVQTVDDAHAADVNVLSWNALQNTYLLTGGDDHMIRIWDTRRIVKGNKKPAATFAHHNGGITSVHWSPHDSTVFAASGDDHQTSIWDISVERADEDMPENESSVVKVDGEELPDQLLFQHMGQKHVKEVRWHPQLKGVLITTSADGFDIFRPAIDA